MALDLDKPISWKLPTPEQKALLEGLQPNILKGHTREFFTILFLTFDDGAAGRAFLKSLVAGPGNPLVKSALVHLQEVDAFNVAKRAKVKHPPMGTAYIGVGLTKAGYDVLGVPQPKQPADPAFQSGMKNAALNDPPVAEWEKTYRGTIHAAVLVGDSKSGSRNAAVHKVLLRVTDALGVHEAGRQTGQSQHNRNGDGIEHFGYVDGRSQPLFLTEDVLHEQLGCDGIANWDPSFGPDRAIVSDPASPAPLNDFGSYFIFRKLEQNVQLFKESEEKFGEDLGLEGDDAERAGAMIVGRFEDGAPATSQFAEGAHHPVPNNFNYDSDGAGGKCPFFGHIRKMNPRGSGGFEGVDDERKHIMARRGQTYGTRTDDLNDGQVANKPTEDVGLLFMAFNANIGEQFDFVQRNWANSPNFPAAPNPPGVDMVIGQTANGGQFPRPQAFGNQAWGEIDKDQVGIDAIPQAVTMKGGEYFFMPSLAFLGSLA